MHDSVLTKKAMASAMKRLMAGKSIAEVSVTDICGECGLNRKSFYYHFVDKRDLVNWILYSELIAPLQEARHASFRDMLTAVMRYMGENRRFYAAALLMRGENSFREYFSLELRPYILRYLHNGLGESVYHTAVDKELAYAEFLADAYVCSVEKWICKYPELEPEKVVDLLCM